MNIMEIKAGDKVRVARGGWSTTEDIAEVDRLTKTQIITTRGERFRRDDGRGVGSNDGRIKGIASNKYLAKARVGEKLLTASSNLYYIILYYIFKTH